MPLANAYANAYANAFAPRDGVLRVHLIAHGPDVKKSDAFVLELNGEYILIDGGMTDCSAVHDYLLALRRRLLDAAPAEADAGVQDLPLKLSWMVSHFHVDHVRATMQYILPDPRFSFDQVYFPPRSSIDPKYQNNDELLYRRPSLALLAEHHPHAVVHEIGFGREALTAFKLADEAEITIYPPDQDWGKPELIDYLVQNYYDGDYGHRRVATAAINACCMWIGVRYAERSCLFTGDTMKRCAHLGDESFDRMCALWGEQIGQVDLLKYLHHGMVRDTAAAGMLAMKPVRVIVGVADATAPDAMRAIASPAEMPEIINCAERSYVVSIAADGGIRVE